MSINQVISGIGVDSAADNGKVPVYNSTTDTFDMTTPGGGSAPVGSLAYGRVAPSADYLPCNGADLSQATYSALFAKIGINPKFDSTIKSILPGVTGGKIVYASSLSLYVCVSNAAVSASTDGVNWNFVSNFHGQANTLTDICWCSGLGMFVICTTQAFVYTSTDGFIWTTSSVDDTTTVTKCMASSTTIVLGGSNNTDNSIQRVYTSTDGVNWTRRTISGSGLTVTSMHYSGGMSLFFIGFSNGSIQSSSDASSWNARTSNIASQINEFDSYASLIVAVGAAGVISSSPDGTTWTSRTQQVGVALTGVAYSSTATIPWVAVGTGITMNSTNGLTWYTLQSSYAGRKNIVWSSTGSKYATVGSNAMAATSTDLDTWTANSMSSAEYAVTWNAMAYGNSAYVAVGSGGKINSSSDATTWTNRTSNAGSNALNDVLWDSTNSLFLVCGAGNIINSSPDGTTWTARTATGTFNSIATNGSGVSVIVGNSGVIFSSSNGTVWTSRTSNTSASLQSVAWNGTKFCATGSAGICVTSTDGTTWTKQSPVGLNVSSVLSLTSDGSNFYGVVSPGGVGFAVQSSDGITWEAYATPSAFSSIQYMNSKLVAYSTTGDTFYSTDGKSWTKSSSNRNSTGFSRIFWFSGLNKYISSMSSGITTSTDGKVFKSVYSATLTDIAYSESQTRYVLVAGSGGIATSTDAGATWTWSYDFTNGSGTTTVTGVSYSPSLDLFVAVCVQGAIYSSTNGTTWTQRSWTYNMISYGNNGYGGLNDIDWSPTLGMFVAVGVGGAIVTSTNGTTWTNRSCPQFSSLSYVTWNESLGIFAIAGVVGFIATSTNGTTWTLRQTNITTAITSITTLEANGFIACCSNLFLYSPNGVSWQLISSPGLSITGKGYYLPQDGGALLTSATTNSSVFSRDGSSIELISVGIVGQTPSAGVYDPDADQLITVCSNSIIALAPRAYAIGSQFVAPSQQNGWIKYQ